MVIDASPSSTRRRLGEGVWCGCCLPHVPMDLQLDLLDDDEDDDVLVLLQDDEVVDDEDVLYFQQLPKHLLNSSRLLLPISMYVGR